MELIPIPSSVNVNDIDILVTKVNFTGIVTHGLIKIGLFELTDVFKACEKHAFQNNGLAFNNIGELYFYGKGVTQNINKAVECFLKGVELNDGACMHNMGYIYEYGHAVSKNVETAKEWYIKSANTNNVYGLLVTGLMFYKGKLGTTINHATAYEYFKKGTQLKNSSCMKYLAEMYLDGLGVEQDIIKGIKLLIESIKLGSLLSATQLLTLLISKPEMTHIVIELLLEDHTNEFNKKTIDAIFGPGADYFTHVWKEKKKLELENAELKKQLNSVVFI